jgi:hypothetical protein
VYQLVLSLVLLSCGAALPLAAQWRLGVELASNSYHGSSHDTSSSHVVDEGRPGGGWAIGVSIRREWRRVGTGLRLSYAKPGFAVTGQGIDLTDKTTGRLLELVSMVGTRVGGIGLSGAVRVELGPSLHLWEFDGEIHPRVGATGAVAYEWLVSSRFTGALRFEAMLSRSWFDATDVPPEFERQVTWRHGVGLGLRYRL